MSLAFCFFMVPPPLKPTEYCPCCGVVLRSLCWRDKPIDVCPPVALPQPLGLVSYVYDDGRAGSKIGRRMTHGWLNIAAVFCSFVGYAIMFTHDEGEDGSFVKVFSRNRQYLSLKTGHICHEHS